MQNDYGIKQVPIEIYKNSSTMICISLLLETKNCYRENNLIFIVIRFECVEYVRLFHFVHNIFIKIDYEHNLYAKEQIQKVK